MDQYEAINKSKSVKLWKIPLAGVYPPQHLPCLVTHRDPSTGRYITNMLTIY